MTWLNLEFHSAAAFYQYNDVNSWGPPSQSGTAEGHFMGR